MTQRRDLATIEDMVDIFVQDATVTTGAGLANLVVSTFSSYYHRSDMTSTSSVTLISTGTLGTWSSGQFLQINSTFMRGWYQFCNPNGMFVNGSTVALHMYGHPSMAPVVMRYDVTRPQRVGVSSFGLAVGISSNPIGAFVTTNTIGVNVTSISAPVGVSSISVGVSTSWFSGGTIATTAAGLLSVDVTSFMGSRGTFTSGDSSVIFSSVSFSTQSVSISGSVDVTSFYGSGLVTTAAGTLGVGRVGVSSFGLGVGVSSIGVGVSTSWFSGGTVVTTAAGLLSVDVTSFMGSRGTFTSGDSSVVYSSVSFSTYPVLHVSTIIAQMSTADISSVRFSVSSVLAPLTVGAVSVSSIWGSPAITSAPGVFSVDVSSIQRGSAVTTAAGTLGVGRVGVSSFGLPVGVSSNVIGANITSVAGVAIDGTGTSSDPFGPV